MTIWIKNPLQAKRFNVQMRTKGRARCVLLYFIHYLFFANLIIIFILRNYKYLPCRQQQQHAASRIIIVLTPDFIQSDFDTLEDITCSSHVLLIKLKQCVLPIQLNFTSYIDLTFNNMNDMTSQNRLLPKIASCLRLPKSICS